MTEMNRIRQCISLIALAEVLKTLNCLNYVNCFTVSASFWGHTVKIDETVDTVTEYR
jgi:hypothetical protein